MHFLRIIAAIRRVREHSVRTQDLRRLSASEASRRAVQMLHCVQHDKTEIAT